MIQEKQASLLKKMQEFDEITRKIQRVVGLSDPSTRTFAKMFQMLPYPHTKTSIPEEGEAEIAKSEEAKKVSDPEERFELPEPEYPEDELKTFCQIFQMISSNDNKLYNKIKNIADFQEP